MPDIIVLGVDPGLNGALCFMGADSVPVIEDMPTLAVERGGRNKREVDMHHIAALIRGGGPDQAFVEHVWAMNRPDKGGDQGGRQSAAAAFAQGKNYGAVLGILAVLRVPTTLVAPVRWKNALLVPSGKDAARMRASQLLPAGSDCWTLKKHDGRAEAALLALYGHRTLSGAGKMREAA